MKFMLAVVCLLLCGVGVYSLSGSALSLYNIQKRLGNYNLPAENSYKFTVLDKHPNSKSSEVDERSISVIQPAENSRHDFIKSVLAQRHTHRPIVKTFNPIYEEARFQEYLADRLLRKHEHRPLKHKRACRGVDRGLKTLRCPSDHSICLLDDMICNDYPDCPDGEDENPAVCLIHDWASRWFSKIQYYLVPTKHT